MSDKITKEATDAMVNDPSIFMYDEIYEDIKGKTKQKQKQIIETSKSKYTVRQEPIKSKYIDSMKRGAFKREREKEIVTEKMNLKKNRLNHDEQNVFITSAYLEQQKEKKKIEEQMRRQQEYNEQHTVNKDKDMIAFSKYLLKNQFGNQQKAKNKDKSNVEKVQAERAPEKQKDKDDKKFCRYLKPAKQTKRVDQPREQKTEVAQTPVVKPKFYSQKNHQIKQKQKTQQQK